MKLKRTKDELQQLVHALAWNDNFDCYTRAGFEKVVWAEIAQSAQWIIFFDIDDMHALNEAHGYGGVNAMIRKSLKMRESDFMAGQWFSGDEFIIVITEDAPGRQASNPVEFSARLAEIFRDNGVPATFAVAPVISHNLLDNVEPAHKLCQDAKRNNRRGSINVAPPEPRFNAEEGQS